MKIENIKACVFDAYGTLFDVNSAAANCKEKLGARWESFANAWRTTQLEYTWLRSLMKRHKNFWDITEDSLDHAMETFKIKKEMRNELLDLYKKLSPYPEVKQCLDHLKTKKIKGKQYVTFHPNTIVYAIPPMILMTTVGLKKVSPEIVEAGKMSGSSRWQMLRYVYIPAARTEILVGVNHLLQFHLNLF